MRREVFLAIAAAGLSLWGIGWGLPDRDRIARVLPEGWDTPQFRRVLETTWHQLYRRLGPNLLFNPDSWSIGFQGEARVPHGWKTAPPILLNSARSFHLRSGHEDESNFLVAISRLRPHRLELNPRIYYYGGAYVYLLGAWIAAGAALTPAVLVPRLGFYLEHTPQIAWIYLLGRLLSAAVYGIAVWLVYRTGKKFFSRPAAVIAATLFAFAPGIVLQTHYMKPHLLGSVFTLAAFHFCASLLRTGNTRHGVWAGVLVGLAGGSALHMWSAALIPLFTAAIRLKAGRSWRAEGKWLTLSGGAAVLAYLLTNPFWLTEFGTVWKAMRTVVEFGGPGWRFSHIPQFVLVGLPKSLTWPLWLCLGWGLATRRNLKDPVRLLAFSSLLGLGMTVWVYPAVALLDHLRYFPALSLACLLAGVRGSEEKGWRRFLWVGAAAYAAVASAVLDHNLHLEAAGNSTKERAGAWVEQHIPPRSELGFVRLPQPSNTPYFQWNRYRLRFMEVGVLAKADRPKKLPRYLVLTCPGYDFRPELRNTLDRHYRLLQAFEPFSLLWVRPPAGELYGNPWIGVYERAH